MNEDILTFLSAAVVLVVVWAFVYAVFGLF